MHPIMFLRRVGKYIIFFHIFFCACNEYALSFLYNVDEMIHHKKSLLSTRNINKNMFFKNTATTRRRPPFPVSAVHTRKNK